MSNKIKVGIQVTDEGSVSTTTRRVSSLKSILDNTVSSASKLKNALKGAVLGTSSRAMPASSFAAAANSPGSATVRQYGNLRGSAEVTGASARDFANQAQGLGGLVRLYATYAANVFAVGAAFRALSGAMDTSNMVEGLNQLGARSGMALGSLSKQLVSATDGAISLREAMESVAKASASGMSSKDILRMGKVAKNASQALGVDMSDALNRITRAITKMEPELLDELGLFTRIDPAVNAYARSVGKSAASLTTFERQLAFSNATLEEGEKKFGAINIDSNPYSKLLATVKDLSQAGLELVNTVLVPVVGFLSKSPTALGVAIAGILSLIVKQALPAIGEFKEGLAASASRAAAVAVKRAQDAQSALSAIRELDVIDVESKMDDQLQAVKNAEAEITKLRGNSLRKNSLLSRLFAEEDLDNIKENEIKKVEAIAKAQDTRASRITDTGRADILRKDSEYLREWAAGVRESKRIHDELVNGIVNGTTASKEYLNTRIALTAAQKAQDSATKKNIIANAAYHGSLTSISGAFTLFKKDVADSGIAMGSFGRAALYARGGVAILGGAMGALLGPISSVLAAIGIISAVLSTLYSLVSENAEASESLSKAIDTSNAAVKTATEVTKIYGDTLSSESVIARANAFSTLASSIKDTADAMVLLQKQNGTIDNIWEGLKGLFGFSQKDSAASSMSKNIMAQLSAIDDPKLKKEIEEKLKTLLKITRIDYAVIDDVLESSSASTFEQVPELFKKVTKEQELNKIAATSLAEGYRSIKDKFLALQNTFRVNDPMTNYLTEVVSQLNNFKDALKQPTVALQEIQDVANSPYKLALFDAKAQNDIIAYADKLKNLNAQLRRYEDDIDAISKSSTMSPKYKKENIAQINDNISNVRESIRGLGEEVGRTLQNVTTSALNKAFDAAGAGLKRSIQEANIGVSKSIIGMLPTTKTSIQEQYKLDVQLIELKRQEITETRNLTNQIKLDIISRERASAEALAREKIQANLSNPAAVEAALNEKNATLERLKERENIIRNPKAEVGKNNRDPETLKEFTEAQGFLKQLAALDGQIRTLGIGKKVAEFTNEFDEDTRTLQAELERINQIYDEKLASPMSETARLAIEREKLAATAQMRATLSTAEISKQIGRSDTILSTDPTNKSALAAKNELTAQLRMQQELQAGRERLSAIANARNLSEAQIAEIIKDQASSSKRLLDSQTSDYEVSVGILDQAQARLDTDLAHGMITKDNYLSQKAALVSQREIESGKLKTLEATLELSKELLEIETKRRSGNFSATELLAEETAANNRYNHKIYQIKSTREQVEEASKEEIYNNSLVSEALNSTSKAFEAFGDSIVDYAQTGKWAFKDMVNSILADLARLILKQQMSSLAASILNPLVSGATGWGTGDITSDTFNSASGSWDTGSLTNPKIKIQAKGGAWDYGVQAFAKGGTFTNSIVDSPTLFKFAKGTGLMGEAGPEAIMPLTRTPEGSLGVRALSGQPNNVEVVINNYSSETATATETTDARGNRRVEITVGDMNASEISRSGSASQKAISSTFGIKPALIRR